MEETKRLKQLLEINEAHKAKDVDELGRNIKIMEAQNCALRKAFAPTPAAALAISDEAKKREQLETERKLQHRVDVLMLQLEINQADVASKTRELERCSERISKLESDLLALQMKSGETHAATVSSNFNASSKHQLLITKCRNDSIYEMSAVKRDESEVTFTAQSLFMHGIPSTGGNVDDDRDNSKEWRHISELQREQQQFLILRNAHEELLNRGDELRSSIKS